jgi:DNA-directed RNA polymerase specialized sigma24 family protein
MPSYQYDPGGSFRGWLRRLCHHRAIDLLRERQNDRSQTLDFERLVDSRRLCDDADGEMDDVQAPTGKLQLLQEARTVQEEVRSKVKPIRWEAFWRVMVEGQAISEAAAALNLKYATVYAGVNHVAELLCAEGRQCKERLLLRNSTLHVEG